ncbi:TlpA family protein disulfide reductase [Seonamhaeicola maritimus]|uniref:TlpA family protein disulfide reductase n=1 Tax=Seonamhaeicola maritimus TaxID=2591822 RepID=UPI00249483FE|nr:TlpA disulfide reductase family protein [Seonamhaeicola maritimus]
MKKYIVLTLALITLWSCKKEEPINYVLLSGKIANTKGGELTISNLLDGYSKTINVKDIGTFSDTLFIKKNGLYKFRFGQDIIFPYLSKGDKVDFQVADAKQFLSTLGFMGDYSEFNNYLANKASKEQGFFKNVDNFKADEAAFETLLAALKKDTESKLETVTKIPEGYKVKEKRAIELKRLSLKAVYEKSHGSIIGDNDIEISDAFKKELSELNMNNPEDYLYSEDYRNMVFFGILNKINESKPKDRQSYIEAREKVFAEIKSEAIRNAELYRNISGSLQRSNDKEKAVNEFLSTSTNEGHKESVKALFELLKTLDPGQPSPKFVNYENYAGGTTSLDDLKGKYVYIDVWATWCGPCKAEIPHLKKVEEQYHDKNITFLSISTDKPKDKQKWKDMIKDKELGGIQLITDNEFKTSFISDYKISGIPRFILLDPKGNIVQANAPRPSDEKLIELFDELNI